MTRDRYKIESKGEQRRRHKRHETILKRREKERKRESNGERE
jgi:hypothetical protein